MSRKIIMVLFALFLSLVFPALSRAQDTDGDGTPDGSDCAPSNPNIWVSCATCQDNDVDTWWTGCDAYTTINGVDCNDGNANVYPGRAEVVADGIDQNCDSVDTCYVDADNDNYGTASTINGLSLNCSTDANRAPNSTDCNDGSATVYPGRAEVVADGIDQDCDAKDMCYVDTDNDNYGTVSTANGLSLNCSADAFRAPVSTDCNDANAAVNPGAVEIVGDGIDQNCNGVDLCYVDTDNDNYGTLATVNGLTLNCSSDANRAPVSSDCNDTNAGVYPGHSETIADGIDQNCDGVDVCYTDTDNDNYGTTSPINGLSLNCSADLNRAPVSTDCNDANAAVNPGAAETAADGLDQDCDGVDLCYVDADNDNFGTTSTVTGLSLNCSTDSNRAPVSTDCNDADPAVYPNAPELCDYIDNQCAGDPGFGVIDETCNPDLDGDGLTNLEEIALGTDPNDPDSDDDGLSDGDEVFLGTYPLVPDSDSDGWLDGLEVLRGSDPLSAASHPGPAGPTQLVNYQGRLTDLAGQPASGVVAMIFGIYSTASGGTPRWSESQNVTVTSGIYHVLLGSVTPLDPDIFAGSTSPAFYLQVTAGGETLTPRQPLAFTPFAMTSSRLVEGRLEMDARQAKIIVAAASVTVHVYFNQAFAAPPRVVVSPLDNEIGGVPFAAAKLSGVTAAGFDVTFRSMTGATAAGTAEFTYQAFGN